jgi:Na+-driven multidrug efflux pump
MDITTGAIRGMGKSIVPMIISLVGACGLRIIWVFTIFRVWNTTTSLYLSYPISWALTFGALFIYSVFVRKNLTSSDRIKTVAQENS